MNALSWKKVFKLPLFCLVDGIKMACLVVHPEQKMIVYPSGHNGSVDLFGARSTTENSCRLFVAWHRGKPISAAAFLTARRAEQRQCTGASAQRTQRKDTVCIHTPIQLQRARAQLSDLSWMKLIKRFFSLFFPFYWNHWSCYLTFQ